LGSLSNLSGVGATDAVNALPDLGSPAANTGSVQPNMSAQGAGFTYHDNIDGKQIILTPQYNQQNGTSIGGSLAGALSKNMAVGVLLSVGSDRNEWLLNTGFDLTSNQRFIFSLGQLRQKQDFNFISGSQKAQVRQDNGAISYQYFLGKNFLNAAEINAYISDTGSVNLGDKTYFTDTTSLYELWSDPRRIAGGRVSGVQGRLVFTPTSKSTLKLGFGGERLSYDLLTGNDSTTRATGSAEFNQRLDYGFNLRASANAGASQNRYAVGVGKSFIGGSQLGLDVATIQGRDNTFNDNQVMLSYTQSFGGGAYASNPLGMNNPTLNNNALSNLDAAGAPMNPPPVNTATPNPTAANWASSLVDQVSRRPSFLPSQVIAKIDTTATPTRLIAIDKTAVPVGSTIDTATGVITAPTGTPVSGIAGVTKNALAFTNAGQFALSGTGLLVVNPNLITQPAVGVTDTYVVTMNNISGGGTTLGTVIVSHGSVKIDSIVMSSGTLVISTAAIAGVTAPVAGATPVTTTTAGTGYTGTVTWSPAVSGTFAYNTAYTATVTLTATSGYTLTGVTANFFTVSGATATNSAGSGVVSAVFPATATLPAGYLSTGTSSGSGSIGSGASWNLSGAGTLIWSKNNSTADYNAAAAACVAMNNSSALGYSIGWRLPTQPELSGFYNTNRSVYSAAGWELRWTRSSTNHSSGHYLVDLNGGDIRGDIDSYNGYNALCVHY
jgi:hypothetical protein